MRSLYLLIFLICFTFNFSIAQHILTGAELKDSLRLAKGYMLEGKIVEKDTFLYIEMPPITIVPNRTFANSEERRKYDRLIRQVKHVYPYAVMVRTTFREIEAHLDSFPNGNDQKKYIKQKETELRARFEEELIRLTVTEGRILIKLVDRETGHSSYDALKQLKGSLNAFFWQSIALMFGSNLKSEYDAQGEDEMIEEIIIQIENGLL